VFFCVFWIYQSTYCSSLYEHCETIGRTMHVVNLDPAAEIFNYPVAMGEWRSFFLFNYLWGEFWVLLTFLTSLNADIRELISLEDVMEDLKLGPNGALMYCMEYPLFWLHWQLENVTSFVKSGLEKLLTLCVKIESVHDMFWISLNF